MVPVGMRQRARSGQIDDPSGRGARRQASPETVRRIFRSGCSAPVESTCPRDGHVFPDRPGARAPRSNTARMACCACTVTMPARSRLFTRSNATIASSRRTPTVLPPSPSAAGPDSDPSARASPDPVTLVQLPGPDLLTRQAGHDKPWIAAAAPGKHLCLANHPPAPAGDGAITKVPEPSRGPAGLHTPAVRPTHLAPDPGHQTWISGKAEHVGHEARICSMIRASSVTGPEEASMFERRSREHRM